MTCRSFTLEVSSFMLSIWGTEMYRTNLKQETCDLEHLHEIRFTFHASRS